MVAVALIGRPRRGEPMELPSLGEKALEGERLGIRGGAMLRVAAAAAAADCILEYFVV